MKHLENGDIIRKDDIRFTPVNKWEYVPIDWVGTYYRETRHGPVKRSVALDGDEAEDPKPVQIP